MLANRSTSCRGGLKGGTEGSPTVMEEAIICRCKAEKNFSLDIKKYLMAEAVFDNLTIRGQVSS